MKSIGVTLQRIYLTKNCKKKHCVRNAAKLSNILDIIKDLILKMCPSDMHYSKY